MSYDVKFLKGIRENYNALPVKDVNTFYYVDETDLYLGEILLSNAEDVKEAVKSIQLNAQAIKTLQDELDAIVDPGGSGTGSISTQINELRTQLTALITANADDIKEEESRAKGIESGLRTDIDKTIQDLTTLQNAVVDNETDIEKKVSDLNTTVGTHTTDINTLKSGDVEVRARLEEVELTTDALEEDVDAVEEIIATLVGSDVKKSIREIAYEELATALVPEEAIDSLDTLQEIAAWIQSHPGDVADINEAILALQGNDSVQDGKITSLEDAVKVINSTESGLLKQAKDYTDTKNVEILAEINGINEDIDAIKDSIIAIEDEETGVLAQANAAILEAIQNLSLGSAAYKNEEYFEKAGAAAEALNQAKAYTDKALTWDPIPVSS